MRREIVAYSASLLLAGSSIGCERVAAKPPAPKPDEFSACMNQAVGEKLAGRWSLPTDLNKPVEVTGIDGSSSTTNYDLEKGTLQIVGLGEEKLLPPQVKDMKTCIAQYSPPKPQ